MDYLRTEPFLEQRDFDPSPAYTWSNNAETFSASYRANELPPCAAYQPWAFSQHLDPCTTAADDQATSHYELAFESSPTFSVATIDDTQSPLATPAMDDHKPLLPDPDELNPARPRRTAGRIPRKPYPVIVPNLTKKARGRQVPTKDMLLQTGSGRVFACQVDSCRKVFTRSEHLKRHTRSIHTHEKPFKCDEPSCGRLFTRHDNLLQHLKNNRHLSAFDDTDCRPLERVRPSPQYADAARDGSAPLSPTMGVLLPPSPQTATLTYSQLPMNDVEGASAYEAAASPASCDDASECTPAPSEAAYTQFDRGYAWQPEVADVYAAPQYEYAAHYQAPQRLAAPSGIPLAMYGYRS